MENVPSVEVSVSETGRRYLDARDIAKICEVSVVTLDTKFRPYAWAMPRDFKWTGHALLIAEDALNELADSFDARGGHDAAIRLRQFLAGHLARVMTERSAVPAAAVEPVSRLLDWERRQE